MKKKLVFGALALSATALFGLTGCDNNDNKPKTYTVTFDHDNDVETENNVITLNKGTTTLDPNLVPAVPEMNGFAGEWDSFTLNDQNITVNAKYGDGTESNPYLVSNATQFVRILDDYTAYQGTSYLNSLGYATTEEDAVTKYVNYKTVSLVYTRADVTEGWQLVNYKTNKVYFKLTNNINLAMANGLSSLNLSGRYFSGEINGQGYNLIGLTGDLFPSTYGAMFENIVNTTFKNMTIHEDGNMGSLALYAYGENYTGSNETDRQRYSSPIKFENIVVRAMNAKPMYISVDDNNESPFLAHAFGEYTTVEFSNCINGADAISAAKYNGIFLGGYAKNIKSLTFRNCINQGNIKSAGSVGVLTGNGSYRPVALNVYTSCRNEGVITSVKESHFLVAQTNGSCGVWANVMDDGDNDATNDKTYVQHYDTASRGYINTGDNATFTALTLQHTASIDDEDITVAKKSGESGNIAKGKYQLILSAYAQNSSTKEGYQSLFTNIVIEKQVSTNVETAEFDDVYYGFMDLNTYNANSSFATKIDTESATIQWNTLQGYSDVKYFVDETNGVYVINFSEYEQKAGVAENKFVLNKTANQLYKVIVVYTTDNQNGVSDIEFVVDFK